MRPACEYAIKYYLPQLRAKVVKLLVEKHGWNISEAAKVLAISPTAAAKYSRLLETSQINSEIIDDVAGILTRRILKKDLSYEEAIEIICGKCIEMRLGGDLCQLHRSFIPALKNCRACFQIAAKGRKVADERSKILDNLRIAIYMLESRHEFSMLIPEVRTNIVMALPNAKSTADIAGVPGRITVYRGKPFAVAPPEFNASKFLASLLLKVMEIDKEKRSMICIKYDEEIRDIIHSSNFTSTEFHGCKNREEYIKRFADSISKLSKIPDAIIDLGGVGIEPVVYIVGRNAVEVVEKVFRILEEYLKSDQTRKDTSSIQRPSHHHLL
ncbi:MAG: hypothetical protein DRJ38_08060 [Thermoprotei archaeon]|nr:MAG: hypothetical protein DRJ38_08060 [Thermoprotei archaeon]